MKRGLLAATVLASTSATTAGAALPEVVTPIPVPAAILAALPERIGAAVRQGSPRCERFNDLPDLPAVAEFQCEAHYQSDRALKVVITRNKPPAGGLCDGDCGDGDRGGGAVRGRWITVDGIRVHLVFSPDEETRSLGFANGTATVGRFTVDVQGQEQHDDTAVETLARGLRYRALR